MKETSRISLNPAKQTPHKCKIAHCSIQIQSASRNYRLDTTNTAHLVAQLMTICPALVAMAAANPTALIAFTPSP